MQNQQFIKAVPGDWVHQKVAVYYYSQQLMPAEVVEALKKSNYLVNVGGQLYKVSATAVANILTGILIAGPAKNKKLAPIDNGATPTVPTIE